MLRLFLFVKFTDALQGKKIFVIILVLIANLAQSVEHLPRKEKVASSILAVSTQGIN